MRQTDDIAIDGERVNEFIVVNYAITVRKCKPKSSHDAVIRVYDHAGNVIETHEHKGDFKEW